MEHELVSALKESVIDKNNINNSLYKFKLMTNREEPLLETLKDLINDCDEFMFSVAFLKEAALKPLLIPFEDAKNRGVEGKIIIGNKQNFSDPEAIERLGLIGNIDVRLNTNHKMHTKGYFFRKDDIWTIIIGSSNLTMSALKTNEEWNMLVNSLENGKMVEEAIEAFDILWNESKLLSNSLEQYRKIYYDTKREALLFSQRIKNSEEITPNLMQREALASLEELRKTKDKALIISATGTGKTFLAAFDVKSFKPERMLFIVHRENIARKAMETFKKLIPDKSMGLYSGSKRENKDFIFCTIQTINKEAHLNVFDKEEFDYIIIDEVHHSGANTYQRVLNYFEPKFLLGLTATPERTDGYNIYELFDYNVPYEIRLNDAIDNDLIVPFHYFGVSEVEIDGEIVDEYSNVSMKEKALNIKEKSNFYGYNGSKVKGLIFVDKVENAKALSIELNKIGYKTSYLCGEDSNQVRDEMISLLESDTEEYLDFIITVDIFNEGIDIPTVNQVLLLRPTSSVIVYVQQLGRGLRKADNKDYLVILDFIGNYKKNFLVPIALSGDSSYDVNSMNLFVEGGTSVMPGNCTINFEKVAKNLILDKIDKKKFSQKKMIENDYELLCQRLNREPLLCDFFFQNMLSPEHILKYKDNYYQVLQNIDKEYSIQLSETEDEYLTYLSKEFTPAKRMHEIVVLEEYIKGNNNVKDINSNIEALVRQDNQIENTENAIKHLKKEIFAKDNTRKKYRPIITNNKINDDFITSYNNTPKFKMYIDDLIEYNKAYVSNYYKQVSESTLQLFKDYERKECFHMLNQDYNAGYQVGGYVRTADEKTVMIFMKADQSSYSNEFLNPKEMIWFSKSGRTIYEEGKGQLEKDIANNKVILELFIRKTEGEKEYYLGKAVVKEYEQTEVDSKKIIRYILELENPVDKILYKYLIT